MHSLDNALPARAGRRAARLATRASALLALGACAFFRTAQSGQTQHSLVINNRTGFEVVVYAVPAPGAVGIRLGNAASFAVTTIPVAQTALQNGSDLVIRLHAIGQATGARDWTSPRVNLTGDVVARLDLRADGYGNMSTSAFYTSPPISSNSH